MHLTGRTTDEKVFESFGESIVSSSRRFLRKAIHTKGAPCTAGPSSKVGYLLPAVLLLGLYVISYLIAARPASPRKRIRSIHPLVSITHPVLQV